jgi:hypothetical protein
MHSKSHHLHMTNAEMSFSGVLSQMVIEMLNLAALSAKR